ncbi:AAA family ATPase, partial [Bacteroides sp. KG68]
MKITHIHIERFRGFQNEDFEVGSQLTAIAGQNGTQKSTLLGIVTQTFTLKPEDPMRAEKPLCGGSYISAFKDKFRLSPIFDRPKGHEWTISFDIGVDDFTVESIKRTGDPNVRFWKKGARQEGDGYISFPTIFLSLKRLVPMAEEAKIITDDTLLTPEELSEFKQLHNKILIVQTPISSATTITSKNKQSIGVSTELYDWNQNSMGQDNLGKIILALFSFKRLHDKYPQQYKGG